MKIEFFNGSEVMKTKFALSNKSQKYLDLPSIGPKIYGVASKYSVGDQMTADCMLPVSHPAAVLTWYINSDTADITYISHQYTVTR